MHISPRRSCAAVGVASLLALSAAPSSAYAQNIPSADVKWTWSGWGGGGYFWSSAFDPSDANTLYLGGDVAGAYKSVDRGKTWKFINNGLHAYGVFGLAVSKSNPKVLYAMTPNGLARSADGGANWTPQETTFKTNLNLSAHRPGSVRPVAVDPKKSDTVYAGSINGLLCKSTDGGATWTKLDYLSALKSKDPASAVEAPIGGVTIAENDPDLVFVAHRKLGIFRSADGGKTWTHPDTPGIASCVSVYPKDSSIVYAAMDTDGVWKSTDGGVTWSPTTAPAPGGKTAIREVVIDPRDAATLHIIGSAGWNGFIAKSTDGGKSWTQNKRFVRDMEANPTLPNQAVADKTSGEMTGGISAVRNLTISPTEPDLLFIAANWNNVLSDDGGKTWKESIRGADITCFHDLRFFGGKVYATAMDEGLLVSDDNGSLWRQLTPLKYTEGTSGHQWRVNIHANEDGKHHIVSTVSPWRASKVYPNGILVSQDGGKTFTRGAGLPDFLPTGDTAWENGYARALATDPKNPDILYLGIDGEKGGGVFKSADGGLTWNRLPSQPGSLRMFYGIAVDPTDSNRLYWGCCGAKGGVWRSDDAGTTWTRSSMPDTWTFNIEVTAAGTVFAGAANLWRSDDHGATWKQLTKFKDRTMVGIAVDPANEDRIWTSAVTWGNSDVGNIYESVDGGKTWTDISGDIGYRKPLVLRYNPETKELWAAGVGAFRTRR